MSRCWIKFCSGRRQRWRAAGLLLVATLWPLAQLGSEFLPQIDEGDLLYMPSTLPGISSREAGRLLQQTDRLIKTIPEVQSVFGKAGRAGQRYRPAAADHAGDHDSVQAEKRMAARHDHG